MFTVGDVFVPSPPKRWEKSSILSYSLNDSLVLILENYPLLCTYKYTLLWWQIDQAVSSRFSKTFLYFLFIFPSLTGDLLVALESLDEFVFDRR